MILLAACAIGALLFLWPFLLPALGLPVPADAAVLALALAAVGGLVVVEVATRRLDARRLALLASLAAIDSALRMALVTGIGGFNPIFLPILCAGFVLGPSFGFLAGALSLVVSALATGGVGPWLPYQLFAAGWVGLAAGVAGLPFRGPVTWRQTLVLAAVGAALGFAYGAVMDVWDWTVYYRGAAGFGWAPGLGPAEALRRFGTFYAVTSALYDTFRAAGNALLVLLVGAPLLAALRRLRLRMGFEVVPLDSLDSAT